MRRAAGKAQDADCGRDRSGGACPGACMHGRGRVVGFAAMHCFEPTSHPQPPHIQALQAENKKLKALLAANGSSDSPNLSRDNLRPPAGRLERQSSTESAPASFRGRGGSGRARDLRGVPHLREEQVWCVVVRCDGLEWVEQAHTHTRMRGHTHAHKHARARATQEDLGYDDPLADHEDNFLVPLDGPSPPSLSQSRLDRQREHGHAELRDAAGRRSAPPLDEDDEEEDLVDLDSLHIGGAVSGLEEEEGDEEGEEEPAFNSAHRSKLAEMRANALRAQETLSGIQQVGARVEVCVEFVLSLCERRGEHSAHKLIIHTHTHTQDLQNCSTPPTHTSNPHL